jgi:hypothetical protein
LSEKAAQCLTTGDVQCVHDGERSAVADLSLESRNARVRENDDRAEYHPQLCYLLLGALQFKF